MQWLMTTCHLLIPKCDSTLLISQPHFAALRIYNLGGKKKKHICCSKKKKKPWTYIETPTSPAWKKDCKLVEEDRSTFQVSEEENQLSPCLVIGWTEIVESFAHSSQVCSSTSEALLAVLSHSLSLVPFSLWFKFFLKPQNISTQKPGKETE